PERPEPYILALPLARDLKESAEILWSACGILEHDWGHEHAERHQQAIDATAEMQRQLRRAGDDSTALKIAQQVAAAQIRDLEIHVEWSGNADLDLEVEEPPGTICSFVTPETAGGGLHLHDGCGPFPEFSYELYACPKAYAGEYRLTIENKSESPAERAVVTITRDAGSPQQSIKRETVSLKDGPAVLRITLQQGRRKVPRAILSQFDPDLLLRLQLAAQALPAQGSRRARKQAVAEMLSSRGQGGPAGAFAVAPGVQVLNEGAILGASAVVSPDRRYVRIAVRPQFNTITDVFTYSILGGQTTSNPGGAGGN
ncbi:MAG: hypothetical protein KDA58_16180, partial [Planctomycetaceae bacterium]|nr:hypothetical protein [Planctomycetaceae bacterium]